MKQAGIHRKYVTSSKTKISGSKLLCQQMHSLLKHKMLQLALKISLDMAPTCFGPLEHHQGAYTGTLLKLQSL
jgi:hypothetical protein